MNEEPTTPPEIRQLPHAIGSEKMILSSLMRFPERIEEPVVSEMFYLPGHQLIFRDVVAARGTWELTSAVQRLHDNGMLSHVGGPAAVAELYTYAPNDYHFSTHLGILRDRMARRMTIRAAQQAAEAAFDCSDDSNYLQAIAEPFTAIFEASADSAPEQGMKALAADFLQRYEDKVNGVEIPDGIMTGIHEVDAKLRGMKPQQIGIISGRSGDGKSTLATQIFSGLSDALYLILERTESSAFARCVIQSARIHHGAVSEPNEHAAMQGRAKPSREELMAIRNAVHRLSGESNLHIVKPSNRKLVTVCAQIRKHVRRHGIKVVFLDQIGLVRGERIKGDTGEAELRGISNTLQELAHELHIHIVVLCQETVDGETKNARAIEEDADWWLSIVTERDKKKQNFREHQHVLIAKDSHHLSGGERLALILDQDTLRFVHGYPKKPAEPEKKKSRFGN